MAINLDPNNVEEPEVETPILSVDSSLDYPLSETYEAIAPVLSQKETETFIAKDVLSEFNKTRTAVKAAKLMFNATPFCPLLQELQDQV